MATADVQCATYPAHLAIEHRAQVVGVDLQPHHFLLALTAQVTGHRSHRFRQHHRRPAVQQPERLAGTAIDRHGGLEEILAQLGKLDAHMADHAAVAGAVQLLQRCFTFPQFHSIISRSACNGWRTPLPSMRFTWLRQE